MPLFKPRQVKADEPTTPVTNQLLTPTKIRLLKNPVFGGEKTESFHKFSYNMEMQLMDENDTTKLDFMLHRLHGAAADAFIQIVTNNASITFEQLKKEMKCYFPEPHSITLQLLRRRKQQPHESLETFAETIKELVNKFYTNSRGYNKQARDHLMVKHFVYNIQPHLKQRLKHSIANFKDLSEVLFKAIHLQQAHQNRQIPQMTRQLSQLRLQERHNHQQSNQRHEPARDQRQLSQQRRTQHCRGRQ